MSNSFHKNNNQTDLSSKSSSGIHSNESDNLRNFNSIKRNSINGINVEQQTETRQKSLKKRNRTAYPPLQKNYGPKATLKKVTDDYLLLIQDPLSQQLSWTKAPLYVLVIKKLCNTLFEPFIKILKYLIYEHNLITYVEESEFENEIFRSDEMILAAMSPSGTNTKPSLRKFCKSSHDNICKHSPLNTDTNKIDFVICLGGDGTLLHASGLFQQSCPPLLSIHLGSLGFLCPFDFENYREFINGVIKGGVPLLLRNRLKCKLEKNLDASQKSDDQSNPSQYQNDCQSKDLSKHEDQDISKELICLNEVVVGRGCSPFLSNLDLYVNDYLITTVQGDGLIISTPTGSTAYAMAAGASMCHPSVQSIIIAPICPHSLSFRPIVVPAGVELKIALSPDSRHTAWFSVDGRNTTELKEGFYISITTSEYPLPSICRSDQINDWFEGLATCLHWNQRQKQLPLNQCYLQSQAQSLFSSKSPSPSSIKLKSDENVKIDDDKKLHEETNGFVDKPKFTLNENQ